MYNNRNILKLQMYYKCLSINTFITLDYKYKGTKLQVAKYLCKPLITNGITKQYISIGNYKFVITNL